MDQCPHCGAATRPGDQFCLRCGNRLAGASPVPVGLGPVSAGGPHDPLPDAPTAPTMQAPLVASGSNSLSGTVTVSGTEPTLSTVNASAPAEPTFATQMAESEERTVQAEPTAQDERTAQEERTVTASEPPTGPMGPHGGVSVSGSDAEETIATMSVAPAKLIVTRNGQAREFLLKKADISIGRAPSNEVPLSGDQLASRRHAVIRFDGANFIIRDLGSANGTYVNGVELRAPTLLRNGDQISVGEHEVLFFTEISNEDSEPETMDLKTSGKGGSEPTFVTSGIFGAGESPDVSVGKTNANGTGGAGAALVEPPAEVMSPEGEAAGPADVMPMGGMVPPEAALWSVDPSAPAQPAAGAPEAMIPPTLEGVDFVEEEVVVVQAQQPVEATLLSPAESVPPVQLPPVQAPPHVSLPAVTILETHLVSSATPPVVDPVQEAIDKETEEPRRIDTELKPPPPPDEEDMPLPVPQLPDVTPIMSAIQALDSKTAEMRDHLQQAKALEAQAQHLRDQLKAASEMISAHDNSVAQLAQSLRAGVADVSNRLKQVIDEVTRAEESLSVKDVMGLIEDVRADPRDIFTVGNLARHARELGLFFELHQRVNQVLAECLTTLNELMAIDVSKPGS